ncbi:MAG TPA: glycosyltransferase family 39 protein [Pyrinomonadaceae bacterium]|jgi:4-amino-4-deoxy-L-arabinose transferase-like glycosyltransferase
MKVDGDVSGAAAGARDFLSRRAAPLCALLLALMGAQMLDVISRKSITVDEWVLIPAGLYHLAEGDFRPVNEHPPVAKVLGAVPLWLAGAKPPQAEPGAQEYRYFLGRFREFWDANAWRFDRLCFWARVPMVAVALLLGALVFVFARRHWGPRAALFAVALYALEPTVTAHGRVVQTDVPSALALLLFSFALYEYLRAASARRGALVGLAAGFAAVTKFSMVALAPVLCVVFACLFALAPRLGGRGLSRGRVAAHAGALALAAVFAVNAGYFFRRGPAQSFDDALAGAVVQLDAGPGTLKRAALEAGHGALQVVFPPDFVSGVGWQLGHAKLGHEAGLLGEHSRYGWWYYFPVAFALKTPLPVLLLTLAGIFRALARLRRGAEGRVLVLVLPPALFTCLLMLSTINIGVRYYLPAYPFFFILAGAALDDLLGRARRRALAAALAAAAMCWTAVEAARAYPDHMAYVNQLAHSKPHWWYLSDSNVEWGDDVRALALYLRGRGEERVGAALLGWHLLDIYGIEPAEVFVPPGEEPDDARYVAVGASLLNGSTVPHAFEDGTELTEEQRVNYFDSYRRRAPEKVFGGSVYLYRVKD